MIWLRRLRHPIWLMEELVRYAVWALTGLGAFGLIVSDEDTPQAGEQEKS